MKNNRGHTIFFWGGEGVQNKCALNAISGVAGKISTVANLDVTSEEVENGTSMMARLWFWDKGTGWAKNEATLHR